MKARSDLFSSDHGLMSVAVIGFMQGMGGWIGAFFKRHMDEDAKKQGAEFIGRADRENQCWRHRPSIAAGSVCVKCAVLMALAMCITQH